MFLVSCLKEITSSLIVIKYSAFHSSKFQLLKCPLSWGNSSRKKRLWRPPFWNTLGSQAVFMWRHSVRLEIGGKEKNLQLTWYPSQGQQNFFFFFDYPLHYLQCYIISEIGACLAQNNYNSRAWEAIRTKFLGRNDVTKRGLAAEYCSKWRQRRSNFGLLWRRISQGQPAL